MIKSITTGCAALLLIAATALGQTFTFNGNGGGGFGGPVGQGSLSFSISGTTVNGTFTRGPGDFNDALVIYIDSLAGGFTDTTSFTDTADYHRRAISGFANGLRAPLTFSGGFAADFAIALAVNSNSFGGLWNLSDTSNFGFVANVNLSPLNNTTAPTFTFSFNLTDIGLSQGQGFNIVTTLLNPNDPYRSNEAIGHNITGTAADPGGNFGQNAALATGFATVPEPSTVSLLAGAALLGAWRIRRRLR